MPRVTETDQDPAADLLRLDAQLCFPLYACTNAVTRLYRPLLAPLGLTYPQYLVMLVLWEVGEASVSDLGDRLRLDSGTLTPLLKRLEVAGLVLRRRDAGDERRVLISLTDAGRGLHEQARDIPVRMACTMALPPPELHALKGALERLLAALDGGLGRPVGDGSAPAAGFPPAGARAIADGPSSP